MSRAGGGRAAVRLALVLGLLPAVGGQGHLDAKRLHDDLLSDYNSLIRPVANQSVKLTVKLSLKLSQLIDINLKQQVMITNVWVEQVWQDYKLRWNPSEYGGVEMIHVPAEDIWLPDIVLFNNADGNYEVTLMTKAKVYYTGEIVWKPPALYKSTCEIDVEYFPFDEQSCLMKFGSWTYDGREVDLRHVKQIGGSHTVLMGIDMSEFYKSVEWDILLVPAIYNEGYYDCCKEPYPDITFNVTMRRKTLFYTVNLIIPCVGISFLTVLVFFLPSDSGEKVTLCISILVSLTVFFLLLAEIIPPTSLAVPLLGKYLLFTMILVTISTAVTVGVLNVHFRSPTTHEMSPWVRRVFMHVMPRLLHMRRPTEMSEENSGPVLSSERCKCRTDFYRSAREPVIEVYHLGYKGNSEEIIHEHDVSWEEKYCKYCLREMQRATESVMYIAEYIRKDDEAQSNLKNQIMTTNVWVTQRWSDHKLMWDPDEYGGVQQLYVPAEQIWLPDIVLYNNADGNYEVTIMTKAIIYSNGTVVWNPPAIYKSSCQIDIQYFPFDDQMCFMKFGSWSYDGYRVDLKHLHEIENKDIVPIGIDLSEFYLSVEWDIMKVPAKRKEKYYSCCEEPYPDITFNLTIRRKSLFYTINLIIPCVGISGLSVLVFYLPSDSGEKVSLCVSILLSLTFFFLVLAEIIPSTSLAMPMLGKYLVFTMILVTLSVIVTIIVLNVHFRSPSTHRMSPWIRRVFIRTLPRLLLMRQPQYKIETDSEDSKDGSKSNGVEPYVKDPLGNNTEKHSGASHFRRAASDDIVIHELESSPGMVERRYPREIERAIHNAMFIAQHIDNQDDFDSIKEDWKYVAMVLDRLFLWIFTIACIVGTVGIFLQAPHLYDTEKPIDVELSKVAHFQEAPTDYADT